MTQRYQDIYRGFTIDYGDHPDGYYAHVLFKNEIVYKASSYDDACNWVDSQHNNQPALGVLQWQV